MADHVTGQGEMIDAIVWRHYGRTDRIAAVLDANPGLAALGPVLPLGTRVILPDAPPAADRPVMRLWGQT